MLALLTGCGVATHVRPVPKGAWVAEASVGGPLVQLGAPVPLPLSSVGATYGLLEGLSVHGHLQPSPLLFGALGADAGATVLLLPEAGAVPALAATGQASVVTDFGRTAAWWYADTSLTASWLLGGRWMPYATVTGQVDFLNGQFQLAPGAGAQLLLERWTLQAEARLYAPGRRTDVSAVPYVTAGGRGAFGLVLGASYRFGH
ncbi:MAG: hypothetical protein L0Y66_24655 [Myxococcaceae bacterium]|nr:hypothetical protein [Myxococcaceae bacterium]